ncbi:MAG: ABC transporter permease, partial [Rhodospirillales bacterium]|nr:ABC transporter permease [Rhodospirillales bacterium]
MELAQARRSRITPRLGRHILADALVAQGIDHVFEVPGESFLDTLDGLYAASKKLKLVTCRFEAGAVNMAEAYGKLTGRPAAAYLVSLPDGNEPELNRIVLRAGRLPERDRNELVMSENMARALGYTPGQKLNVLLGGRKQLFTVSGIALSPEFVYVLAPGQLMPDDKAFGILWLRRSLMEAAYDMNGAFNDVSLTLSPGASEPQVRRRIDLLLARFGGTAAYGRDDQTSHAYISQEL